MPLLITLCYSCTFKSREQFCPTSRRWLWLFNFTVAEIFFVTLNLLSLCQWHSTARSQAQNYPFQDWSVLLDKDLFIKKNSQKQYMAKYCVLPVFMNKTLFANSVLSGTNILRNIWQNYFMLNLQS